jgi:hypothetical protein
MSFRMSPSERPCRLTRTIHRWQISGGKARSILGMNSFCVLLLHGWFSARCSPQFQLVLKMAAYHKKKLVCSVIGKEQVNNRCAAAFHTQFHEEHTVQCPFMPRARHVSRKGTLAKCPGSPSVSGAAADPVYACI